MPRTIRTLVLGGMLAVALPGAAAAGLVVTVTQSGNAVIVNTTGSISLSGLTLTDPGVNLSTGLRGNPVYVSGGPSATVAGYTGFTGPVSIGTGFYTGATTSTGTSFAFAAPSSGAPVLFLPQNYVSGAAISSAQSYANSTLTSLGLTTGSYAYSSSADTLTINVAPAAPEPATWAMLILGFGAIGVALRRRSIATLRISCDALGLMVAQRCDGLASCDSAG